MAAGLWWVFPASAQTINVSFPAARFGTPLDGRLLLPLSNDPSAEPRMQIDDTPKSQMIFGVTADGWKPDAPLTVGDNAQGYPRASLKDVPAGDDTIQAALNVYETFHRSDGKTIKLAPDRGEGQHWNLAPGNLDHQTAGHCWNGSRQAELVLAAAQRSDGCSADHGAHSDELAILIAGFNNVH